MSDQAPARPSSTAEAAREYRQTLVEHYRHSRQGKPPPTPGAGKRPAEAQLPAAVRELIQRVRTEQPQRRFELLKYRHSVGEQVVTEIDDGAPLPPEDQLMVASVTTSLVLGDQITVEVHMVIGAWKEGVR
jgi:hypothetical protein